jgi:hypothetical protein
MTKHLWMSLAFLLAAPAARAQGPGSMVPARVQRKFAVLGELGWNSLAGLGANVSYSPISRLTAELGVGLSMAGFKAGARVRGNLFDSTWTPTAGVGFLVNSGSADSSFDVTIPPDTATLQLRPAPFLQPVIGMSYVGDGGFTFLGTVGYAFVLGEHPAVLVSGSPEVFDQLRAFYGSGLVFSAAFGYSF